jgi:hypothetical protein
MEDGTQDGTLFIKFQWRWAFPVEAYLSFELHLN